MVGRSVLWSVTHSFDKSHGARRGTANWFDTLFVCLFFGLFVCSFTYILCHPKITLLPESNTFRFMDLPKRATKTPSRPKPTGLSSCLVEPPCKQPKNYLWTNPLTDTPACNTNRRVTLSSHHAGGWAATHNPPSRSVTIFSRVLRDSITMAKKKKTVISIYSYALIFLICLKSF